MNESKRERKLRVRAENAKARKRRAYARAVKVMARNTVLTSDAQGTMADAFRSAT